VLFTVGLLNHSDGWALIFCMSGTSPVTELPSAGQRRWGYLATGAVLLGTLAVLVVRPDLPSALLGSQVARPDTLGSSPVQAGAITGRLPGGREATDAPLGIGPVTTATATPAPADAITPAQTATAAPKGTNDEVRAGEILDVAEKHYAAMAWDAAGSTARHIAPLSCRQTTRDRAGEIARGAEALKRLFSELDDRDELSRNWDTHPSLLSLTRNGSESLVVPISSLDDPLTPVLDNPLAWVENLRAQGAKGSFLLKGAKQFSKASLQLGGYVVTKVDTPQQAGLLRQQLGGMLARIEADPTLRSDPNAWYEAGKFAYRNRLDDRVTMALDRAFQLDPRLSQTVRETNAAALAGSMIAHLKAGNHRQAEGFMAAIERHYKDTRQAELARLYYHGRTADLLTATRETHSQQRPVESPASDSATPPQVVNAPADLAQARASCSAGRKPYLEAMDLPATDERNRLYHEALGFFLRSKAAYLAYCEAHPTDDAAATELFETNSMIAAVRKYLTL